MYKIEQTETQIPINLASKRMPYVLSYNTALNDTLVGGVR